MSVMSQIFFLIKKKKKVMVRFLGTTRAPPTISLPHHSFSIHLILSWPAHPFLALFSIFLFSLKHSSLHSLTLSIGTSIPPSPPSFFRQCHRKIFRNLYTSSSHLFEVKISNLFGGFHTFT